MINPIISNHNSILTLITCLVLSPAAKIGPSGRPGKSASQEFPEQMMNPIICNDSPIHVGVS